MTKTIAIMTFTCLHTLLSPASVRPGLAKSALTNYPVKVKKESHSHSARDLETSTVKPTPPTEPSDSKNVSARPGNRLPPAMEKLLSLGDLTFKTGSLGKSPADQALILRNTYIEAALLDANRSRPIQQVPSDLAESNGHYYVSGHLNGSALKTQLKNTNLDRMSLQISIREYEWFGHGDRITTLSMPLRPLLEQLSATPAVSNILPVTQTKIYLDFEPNHSGKTK